MSATCFHNVDLLKAHCYICGIGGEQNKLSTICFHNVDLETMYCNKCDCGGEPRTPKMKFKQIFACGDQLYGLEENGSVYRYIHETIDGELIDGWTRLNNKEINIPEGRIN